MGRSNKKVKSERISALRKQYDSYLEEDKKRKERNEYILGKLDKMVYSTALVPVRHKAITMPINRPSAMYLSEPEVPAVRVVNPSDIIKQQLTPDIPLQNIDDTYLIQEISKNYILIPKLRSPFINKYGPQAIPVRDTGILPDVNNINEILAPKTSTVQPDDKENTDWKSKYEILNILKNEEKEKHTVQFADETRLNKETPLNDMIDNIAISCNNDLATKAYPDTNKYLNEVPEKDISDEKVNLKLELNAKTVPQADPMPRDNTDQIFAASIDAVPNIDYTLENTNLEFNDTEGHYINPAGEVINYAENANVYPEANVTNPSGEVTNYADHEEYNYTEPVDPEQTGDQYNYTKPINPEQTEDQYNYTEPVDFEQTGQTRYVEHYEPINDLNTTTEEQHYEPVKDLNDITQDQSANQLSDSVYAGHVENNESGYVEHVENSQNLYVEQESDLTYNPEGMTEQYALDHSEKEDYQSHVNNPNDYVQENINDQTFADSNAADYVGYETESTNVKDVAEYQMKSATDTRPGGDTVEKTGVDVNDPSLDIENNLNIPPNVAPEVKEGEVTEESPDVTGIEDFEAEQREMFYSEHSNEQYGYQEGDADLQMYPQHEAYQQQQNADYYEGAVPEPYPVDVGENEHTLMYDPSYQEQYQNSIESAYRQGQPQEYENHEGYEPMQPLDMLHQLSYENVEQVQTVLDTEEGYTEQAPDKK